MNTKYLRLKFALLAIGVAVALLLARFKGPAWGIDLVGGHSLTFEYETRPGDPANLADRIIKVIKERIDPVGILSLEIRPVGNNRIEVRMPAGRPETRQAYNEYQDALNRLEARNLKVSDLRRVELADSDRRDRAIDSILRRTGAGEDVGRDLRELGRLADRLDEARQARTDAQARLDGAPADANRAPLEAALASARNEFIDARQALREQRQALQARNIHRRDLQRALQNYVPSRVAEAMAGSAEELQRRRETYQRRLDTLREEFPSRLEEIDRIVELHKTWAEMRTGLDDPADLQRLIAKAGVLEFRIAPANPRLSPQGSPVKREDLNRYEAMLEQEGPDVTREMKARGEPFVWYPIHGREQGFGSLATASDRAGQRYVLLDDRPNYRMTQDEGKWTLQQAAVFTGPEGLAIQFALDAQGERIMSSLTSANEGKQMAIVLDDEVYSAPTIQTVIHSRGQITGSFTRDEAAELARILQAGSLPRRLNPEPVSKTSFGPTIGERNRNVGFYAGVIGLILVAAFMLVYYLYAGLIADVALVLNVLFIIGAMSALGAVFTLPGIAGVILTIGIAVDANVLIFERLREEQQRGQAVRSAIKTAYERAFSAIFDANITTLITCLILGWVGTEEVKGFAVTLGLGILFSLFTALVVTRWVFQVLLDTGLVKKPVFMLKIIDVPKINWMGLRYIFWCVSGVLLAMGLGSLWWQGSNVLGIEFSAGTQAVLRLKDDALLTDPDSGEKVLPNDGLVRRLFLQKGVSDPNVARQDVTGKLASSRVERRIDPLAASRFVDHYDTDGDGKVALAEWTGQDKDADYFAKLLASLDDDGDEALDSGELGSLPSDEYQITTPDTRGGLVRQAMRIAFGEALDLRPKLSFDVLDAGDADPAAVALRERLGFVPGSDGSKRITPDVRAQAVANGFEEFVDFEGGLAMVLRNVQPAIARQDVEERIRQIRTQEDFEPWQADRIAVIPLARSQDDPELLTAFAILDHPDDPQRLASAEAFASFADGARESIAAALQREESIDMVNYDPAIAGEAAQRAVFAIVLSWVAIVIYLWIRFGSARWGVAAVICLVHDVVIVVGLVAASGWVADTFLGTALMIQSFKIDLPMIAALLTVIGYSVNDTIVVFDRIRENRGRMTTLTPGVINSSINQTLARTLLTSTTTLIVVVTMYVAGGAGIHAFSFALLAGVLFGTYSSVAVASPLLMGFKEAIVARVSPAEAAAE